MKKCLAIIAAFLCLTLTGCCFQGFGNGAEIVAEAESAVQDGDIRRAYDLLKENEGNKLVDAMLAKFIFVPTRETISSRTWHEYTYDENGNLLLEHYVTGKYWQKWASTYDENDRLLIYEVSGNDERKDEGKDMWLSRTIYTYDDAGNVLTEIWRSDSGNSSKTVYTYDAHGNVLTEEYDYGNLHLNVYTYDANGNKLTDQYYSNGVPHWKTTYTYDKKGNLVMESGSDWERVYTYDKNGNLLTEDYLGDGSWSKDVYTYDGDGNKLTYRSDRDGDDWQEYTYAYDGNGNRVSEVYSSPDGDRKTTYTRDADGNVMTETTVEPDGGRYSENYTWKLIYCPNGVPEDTARLCDSLNARN